MVVAKETKATWVRNFNPLVPDGSRWPTKAGVYEPLAVFNGMTGEWVPWLATTWQWNPDHTVLDVSIRQGVKWSDGHPFSAADVLFSFALIKKHPALDSGGLWAFLQDVTRPDDHRIRFRFKKAYVPGFGEVMGLPIVATHIWSEVDKPVTFANPDPVGTGPFTEVRVFREQIFELGRNPHYWQPGRPYLDGLRFPAMGSNDQANLALVRGDLDWAGNFVPVIERTYVKRDPEHFKYWFPLHGSTVFLYLNTTKQPFDDPAVRKAISQAIDREKVVHIASYDYTKPADVTGLSGSYDRWRDPTLVEGRSWVDYDPDAARKVLAPYTQGEDGLSLEIIVVAGWNDWVRAAQVIASNLKEVGIDARVKTYDFGAWFERLHKGEFEGGISWSMEGATPYAFYRWLLDPRKVKPVGESSPGNWHRYGHPKGQALLEAFEVTSDPKEQQRLSRQLQALFVSEAPAIPLFPNPSWGICNTRRIVGFPSPDNPYAHLSPNHGAENLIVLTQLRPRGEP